jgi:leucyl/phenylalanyl-tRNA---protein transferase
MKNEIFPDPTPYDDIVAVSETINEKLLTEGYQKGFFPWPHDGFDGIPWFHPLNRAVLFLEEITVNDSLKKSIRRSVRDHWRFTLNHDFKSVIAACRDTARPGQAGTWITPEITTEYQRLHENGFAHSIECWNEKESLIGGIYGVYAGGFFSAESMFYRESDASKLCLLQLARLLKEKGELLLDIQMLTPHLKKLGAREIPRAKFLRALAKTSLNFSRSPHLFESQNEASRSLASL